MNMTEKCGAWDGAAIESMAIPETVYLYESDKDYEYTTSQPKGKILIAIFYNGNESLGTHYMAQDPSSPNGDYRIYRY